MIALQETTTQATGLQEKPENGKSRLREVADQVVGQIFYGTMLRQMRKSAFKGKYGHGGRGEEVFQAQLHDVLATRAGGARGNSVTEAIVGRYQKAADAMAAYRENQREAMRTLQQELLSQQDSVEEIQ